MKTNITFLFIITLLLSFTSCEKDDPQILFYIQNDTSVPVQCGLIVDYISPNHDKLVVNGFNEAVSIFPYLDEFYVRFKDMQNILLRVDDLASISRDPRDMSNWAFRIWDDGDYKYTYHIDDAIYNLAKEKFLE